MNLCSANKGAPQNVGEFPEAFAAFHDPVFGERVDAASRYVARDAGGAHSRSAESSCAKSADVPGQSQARDLPLHERRSLARRYVRPQAEAHRGSSQEVQEGLSTR